MTFPGALRVLVADHEQRAEHPAPDVCVDCLLFLPKKRGQRATTGSSRWRGDAGAASR
jgi:hypothetical protein